MGSLLNARNYCLPVLYGKTVLKTSVKILGAESFCVKLQAVGTMALLKTDSAASIF